MYTRGDFLYAFNFTFLQSILENDITVKLGRRLGSSFSLRVAEVDVVQSKLLAKTKKLKLDISARV